MIRNTNLDANMTAREGRKLVGRIFTISDFSDLSDEDDDKFAYSIDAKPFSY
jgi:hypothetical protein